MMTHDKKFFLPTATIILMTTLYRLNKTSKNCNSLNYE